MAFQFGTQVLDRVNFATCACVADRPSDYDRAAVHTAFRFFDRGYRRAVHNGYHTASQYKLRAQQIWDALGAEPAKGE